MHALIIEDEYYIAADIESRLSDLGFTSFDRAATEEQAVAFALQRRPDLITADQRLREGTGASAVRRIVERHPVPVVYVTGSRTEMDGIADAIIVEKPFDRATFRRAVAAACAARPALDRAPFDLASPGRAQGRGEPEPQP